MGNLLFYNYYTEDIDSFYNLRLDEGYSTSYIRKMHPKITLETYAHLIPNVDNELANIFQKTVEQSHEQNVSKSRN